MDQALQILLNGKERADNPVLRDVPPETTLQELKALRARALGDVLTLHLLRLNQERIGIAVPTGSRVYDLKQEIQRVIAAAEEPALGGRHLSWKSVWKIWTLVCENQELRDPRMLLSDAGVANGSEITFRPQTRMRRRAMRGDTGASLSKLERHSHNYNKKRTTTATPASQYSVQM